MSSRDLKFILNLCRADEQRGHKQIPKQPRPDLLNRLHKLPPADQNLLNLALTGRHTFRQIAALVGSNPGSVCRRVTLLSKRLSHPLVAALLDRPLGLSEKFINIGLERHLFRHGVRHIALRTDCPEREIRSILHYLEKWLRLAREMNDEEQIRQVKPIRNHQTSIASIAQQNKGERACLTNP